MTSHHTLSGRCALGAAAALVLACTTLQAAPVFADWTSANASTDVATGTLGFTTVSLSIGLGGDLSSSVIDGSFTGYAGAAFSPALASSDTLILAGNGYLGSRYTITFGEAVLDPVFQLASLASELLFFDQDWQALAVTEVSDDGRLTTSGNSVAGTAVGSTDANGTVRVLGTYTTLRVSAFYSSREEFYFQVGATQIPAPPPPPPPPPPPSDVPEPTMPALLATALAGLALTRRRT